MVKRIVRVRGLKGDAVVGSYPGEDGLLGGYIKFTTDEVENGVIKEFPLCKDIEREDENKTIEIVEIIDVETEGEKLAGRETETKGRTRRTSGRKAK